ncbi:apolipoprotein N-acyltransferase [Galbibacter mesophilus]|uniref:apolipoprotein N-acyltransferase n=1 Tax=Galbibacter mesophilus TaxID=379069 RepID=UPI00191F4837|nr:apolipoprotein N-acyltransferase [Galbibacter mesophilus]MCM5661663.1 apolipoprotein N-acyltransferase [Galbibacter mesophilus]
MKKSILLAILSGLLLALAWPTYGIPILAFIGFVPLLLAEKQIRESELKRKGAKVFFTSYLAFIIWNSITTWWIWYSTPFGMFFALAVNSLLMTIIFSLYHFVAKRLPAKIHLIFLPAIWMAFEKFHLNWDFSWPWLSLGNVFSEYTTWIQWYEYTGTFGGALWIWIINIGVYKTIIKYQQTKNRNVLTKGIARNVLLVAIPVIVSLFLLHNYKEAEEKAQVTLLQPNIDPYSEKYNISNLQMTKDLIDLAKSDVTSGTNYVIAPETAIAKGAPIDKFDNSMEKKMLQNFVLQFPNMQFITGVDFYRHYRDKKQPSATANYYGPNGWFDFYNAAVQINQNKVSEKYVKSKLVVGVENFPFKSFLEPLLGDVMLDLGGTVAMRATQKERGVFTSNNQQFVAAPIICYESIYGEFVTGYVKNGANFLAIITNDAWWDNTQGHKQHLSYARLRAIETRKSVARSANTGISAFINEKGEVEKTLAYNQKGALSGEISINSKETFYVKYGDFIARISVLFAGMILLYAIARKKG